MCTLITSKGTDIDENIANQNHATRTRTPKPGYLNLSILRPGPFISLQVARLRNHTVKYKRPVYNNVISNKVNKVGKKNFLPGSTTWRQKFPATNGVFLC